MWNTWLLRVTILGLLFFETPFCYGEALNPFVVSKYPHSIAILEDYTLFMEQLSHVDSLHVKLEKINDYIHRIVPKYDDINSNTDYWEFLVAGGEDCEDCVIAKY